MSQKQLETTFNKANDSCIVTYPAPEGEILSKDYTVEVNGQPVDVYTARVNDPPIDHLDYGGTYSFVYFDFSGSAMLKIRRQNPCQMQKTCIRPVAKGIKPRLIDENTAIITLDKPCQLSFEPQGKKRPLLIFANPIEENIPQNDSANVIYFAPGIHRPEDGVIEVKGNQTLYLAGGAVVHAALLVKEAENVNIKGRGILCGNPWSHLKGPLPSLINLQASQNITIEGIILRGSYAWTLVPNNCDNVTITNIKICNGRVLNDDGINPCNSRHVLIKDCFIRSDDDCIALKGLRKEWGDVDDIRVENSILWCDRARITLLAHESRAQQMRNIVYRNIDVVHFTMPVFMLEPGEEMILADVLFENIRIHGEAQNRLAVIRPTVNQYMRTKVPGHIRNIHFEDISVFGCPGKYQLVIEGYNEDYRTEDIELDNVTICGETVTSNSPYLQIGEYAKGIKVQP